MLLRKRWFSRRLASTCGLQCGVQRIITDGFVRKFDASRIPPFFGPFSLSSVPAFLVFFFVLEYRVTRYFVMISRYRSC